MALIVLVAIALSGCGVLLPYFYDAQTLDERLSVPMTRDEVLKQLGKPDKVVRDNGQQLVWEYRFYAKREWVAYLIHCPFHPNCYFPAEPPAPYHVAFRNDQLCLWGTPSVVRILEWKACPADSIASVSPSRRVPLRAGIQIEVVPVFMPVLLSPLPKRLAVLPARREVDERLASWMDLTLHFLRSRHAELVFVERQDLNPVFDEVAIQHSGRVNEDTMARVGKLTGADSLLVYGLTLTQNRESISASFEVRLIRIEDGTRLFSQVATVTVLTVGSEKEPSSSRRSDDLARQVVVEEAVAHGLAAFTATFGDNPLGIVPDLTWPGEGVRLIGLLEDGPASRAGVKPGDRIRRTDGQRFRYWTGGRALPRVLTIERDGMTLEIPVLASPEFGEIQIRQ
jgi:hypothetical protein